MGFHLLYYISLCQVCIWHTAFAMTLSFRDDTELRLIYAGTFFFKHNVKFPITLTLI